jgi:hypothetical protein
MRIPKAVSCGALSAALFGCGAHDNDRIPADLLEAIAAGTGESDYPPGPYGTEVGDIAQNVCIEAWRDPKAENYDVERLSRLCFSDFWDPEGESQQLLLVNTSALWCAACRAEFGGSGARSSLQEELESRPGLAVLGALFQDAEFEPANAEHARLWAQTFEVSFAFGVDTPFAMGAYADPTVQPFNLLLDARDMRILLEVQGDEPGTLWPAIDERLAR